MKGDSFLIKLMRLIGSYYNDLDSFKESVIDEFNGIDIDNYEHILHARLLPLSFIVPLYIVLDLESVEQVLLK